MHVHDTPPALSDFCSNVTPQIDRVIAKALSKFPEDRYQTAGMFSAAFAEAVANADNYVLTDSEAKMKAMAPSNGAKKAKAPIKPIDRWISSFEKIQSNMANCLASDFTACSNHRLDFKRLPGKQIQQYKS